MSKSSEIVDAKGLSSTELVSVLNSALADEYLAAFQYLLGAPIVYGLERKNIEDTMYKHYEEEMEHAKWLTQRIIELDGTPLINPTQWFKVTNCGYIEPNNPKTDVIVEQVLTAERCAIEVYNSILDKVKDKDPVTFDIIRKILSEEEEHERDFMDYQDDLKEAKSQVL